MTARDLTLHISAKLAGEWSAPNVAGMLTPPITEYLVSKWGSLDTMVKTRLLLAPLSMKPGDLEGLRPSLQTMVQTGAADKDEWVRVMAMEVGPYDGRMHLDAVAADFKLVGKTLAELRAGLRDVDPSLFRPHEEMYLHPALLAARGSTPPTPALPHRHFRARQRAEAPSARAGGEAAAGGAPSTRPVGPTTAVARPSAPSGPRAAQRPAADIFISRPGPPGRPKLGLPGRAAGPARRTATLDIAAVAALNQQAAAEKERKAREEREAREALARQRAEEREAGKAEREAAKAAAKAAKDASRTADRAAGSTKAVAGADKAVGPPAPTQTIPLK